MKLFYIIAAHKHEGNFVSDGKVLVSPCKANGHRKVVNTATQWGCSL